MLLLARDCGLQGPGGSYPELSPEKDREGAGLGVSWFFPVPVCGPGQNGRLRLNERPERCSSCRLAQAILAQGHLADAGGPVGS